MSIRAKRIQQFHAIMSHMGIMDSKATMLGAYGVEHTTDLTDEQLDELVSRLVHMMNNRYSNNEELKKWRSNVLTMLNKYGIYTTNNDWSKVNTFLLDERISGKMLYELSVSELIALHRKLMAIMAKRQAIVDEEKRLAMEN